MAEPQAAAARILFVGDVVGGLGRRTLLDCLPLLRERYMPTFVVVNAENIAGGVGITPKIADELLAKGVDAITLGNHTYRRKRPPTSWAAQRAHRSRSSRNYLPERKRTVRRSFS